MAAVDGFLVATDNTHTPSFGSGNASAFKRQRSRSLSAEVFAMKQKSKVETTNRSSLSPPNLRRQAKRSRLKSPRNSKSRTTAPTSMRTMAMANAVKIKYLPTFQNGGAKKVNNLLLHNPSLSHASRPPPLMTKNQIQQNKRAARLYSLMATERRYLARGRAPHGPPNAYWSVDGAQKGQMKMTWRKKVVEWLLQFPNELTITNYTVATAVSIMDRYLSLVQEPKANLQVVGLVCVFLASKMHEKHEIRMDECVNICGAGDTYEADVQTKNRIKAIERKVLETLGWNLMMPTTHEFALLIMDFVANSEAEKYMPLCLDIQMLDGIFLSWNPSTIAVASVLVCQHLVAVNTGVVKPDELKDEAEDLFHALNVLGHQFHHTHLHIDSHEIKTIQLRLWTIIKTCFPHFIRSRTASPTSVADIDIEAATQPPLMPPSPPVSPEMSGMPRPLPIVAAGADNLNAAPTVTCSLVATERCVDLTACNEELL